MGDVKGALSDLDQAILVNPDSTSALNSRVFIRMRMGDSKDSCQDLQKSAALGSQEVSKFIPSVCP